MESSLFDIELPALGKTLSVPLTYASVVAGETNPTQNSTQHDIDLRDLYNYSGLWSSVVTYILIRQNNQFYI